MLRGLLLIGLELTVVNFAWQGKYEVLYLQVMWAIGFSMVVLAFMSGLPRWLLAMLGFVSFICLLFWAKLDLRCV